jgi:small GTP-binding protein
MSSYDYFFEVLVLGEQSDALSERYCFSIFNSSNRFTTGMELFVKTIELNDKKIKLGIWHVSKEERFRFLLPTFCLGKNGAFILYDITNPKTLDNVTEWTHIVREKAGAIPIMLVGTNLDLAEAQRQITREYGIQLAEKNELDSFGEISIKTGQNVDKIFEVMVKLMLQRSETR